MTLTDALLGAAALWLLLVICGFPGQRGRAPETVWEDASSAWASPGVPTDAVTFSVGHLDVPESQRVTPPVPEREAVSGVACALSHEPVAPKLRFDSQGSAPVHAAGLLNVVSRTGLTIAPGEEFSLVGLGDSGLIVLNTGLVELHNRGGSADPILTVSIVEVPGLHA